MTKPTDRHRSQAIGSVWSVAIIANEVETVGDTKFRQTGRRTRKGPYKADMRDIRRREGEERNEVWRKLTSAEKLRALDERLGTGVGAKRQRAVLQGV